eukprot:TRINITY_DN8234_c0_g1_i2.p1 TRINITY_DN8234_c0_g1~~TRINITY_DN8234_c0_g1_i2.p1  ORF type:complete len:157 (+),score=48.48 TRINITY_DN8234_c0_g1_i2:142-612(+)
MIRRPPRSTLSSSSAASDVYKRQGINAEYGDEFVAMVMFRAVLCLASLQMALGLWRDCGDTNATLHFQSVGSIPDPLHTGQNQTIFKHGWSDVDIPGDNLASTFSQYWCFTHCHNADGSIKWLSLIHISEPTRLLSISYAVFCLKKKKKKTQHYSV